MTAIEQAIAAMENVAIDTAKDRIELSRRMLHSNFPPADPTDKVAGHAYAVVQKLSLRTVREATQTINRIAG